MPEDYNLIGCLITLSVILVVTFILQKLFGWEKVASDTPCGILYSLEGANMVSKQRKAINRAMGKLLLPNLYFEQIPLSDIMDIIKEHGFLVVDEAGDPWQGFLCGREGTAVFDIISNDGKKSKYCLVLQWYKMPSGKYEIVSYVG